MLIVLMYHRVTQTPFPYQKGAFEHHLTYLSKHYPIIVPGDKIDPHRISLCLTFDDAYYDFYHTVFPLLQKLGIPAVLAIPSGLILDNTTLDDQTRLQIPYDQAIHAYQTHATLCTWQEINTMVASNLVIPASHGLTHKPLTQPNLNFEQEVIDSKKLLEDKTQKTVETFIYPHGATTRSLNKRVSQHYRYAMRIGSALNLSWGNRGKVIYRMNAEAFWPQRKTLFTPSHKLALGLRFLSNTLRFK